MSKTRRSFSDALAERFADGRRYIRPQVVPSFVLTLLTLRLRVKGGPSRMDLVFSHFTGSNLVERWSRFRKFSTFAKCSGPWYLNIWTLWTGLACTIKAFHHYLPKGGTSLDFFDKIMVESSCNVLYIYFFQFLSPFQFQQFSSFLWSVRSSIWKERCCSQINSVSYEYFLTREIFIWQNLGRIFSLSLSLLVLTAENF